MSAAALPAASPLLPSPPAGAAAPWERPPAVQYIDVTFTACDMAAVLAALADRPPEAPFVYVVTPNVDHVVRLQRSRSDLWPAYRGAWMTLCDSRILAHLARQGGCVLPVVPGSDLTAALFARVVQPRDRVAVLGGSAAMIAELSARYRLRDLVHHDPPMGFIHDPREVARAIGFLVESRARYSFLAVGSPQQEIIAYRLARAGGGTGIGLCVGASLDFLTGRQERAPLLFQRLSLEWLYRLASNPRRMWRRYLIDGPEIFQIARSWDRSHVPA